MAEAGDFGGLGGGQLLGHHGPGQVELEAERVSGTKPRGQLVHLHVGSSQPGSRGVLIIFPRILIRMCDMILLQVGCDNMELDCGATDVDYVLGAQYDWRWNLSNFKSCLRQKCVKGSDGKYRNRS